MTNRITDTMLANNAPPDSDTVLDIACSSDQLNVRDQAGRQVHGADLGAVTELQHRRDDVDDHRRVELVDVVHPRVGDVTDEVTEVQRRREQHEEPEHHLLEVHSVDATQLTACGTLNATLPPDCDLTS
jgi:hypothetical protein